MGALYLCVCVCVCVYVRCCVVLCCGAYVCAYRNVLNVSAYESDAGDMLAICIVNCNCNMCNMYEKKERELTVS